MVRAALFAAGFLAAACAFTARRFLYVSARADRRIGEM